MLIENINRGGVTGERSSEFRSKVATRQNGFWFFTTAIVPQQHCLLFCIFCVRCESFFFFSLCQIKIIHRIRRKRLTVFQIKLQLHRAGDLSSDTQPRSFLMARRVIITLNIFALEFLVNPCRWYCETV